MVFTPPGVCSVSVTVGLAWVGGSLLVALISASALELAMRPRCIRPATGGLAGWLVRLGTHGVLFALVLAVLWRPGFAAGLVIALHIALWLVNNAKYRALQEPFILHDFEYFTEAIRHPRLYLPFMGTGLALAGLFALVVAIGAGLWWEPTLPGEWGLLVGLTGLIAGLSAVAVAAGLRRLPSAALAPEQDLAALGFWGMVWRYAGLLRQPLVLPDRKVPFAPEGAVGAAPPAVHTGRRAPDLLLVQSESFFDPRPHFPVVAPDVLAGFDRVREQASQSGRLAVPAWGANTVRTEASVLTGIAPPAYGVRRFNPYAAMARRAVPNLAGWLQAQGYRTVCIHPYPASFYRRDRVFARMGFDHFIGVEAFSAPERCGQYIGDAAVTERVEQWLAAPKTEPLFVFVITMENHGPLHLEQPAAEDASRFYREGVAPAHAADLTVYLKHLSNADRMLTRLADHLATWRPEAVLGWYGDHVPIMADVYRHYGAPPGETDYLIWSPGLNGDTNCRDIGVESLAPALVQSLRSVEKGQNGSG